MSTKNTEMRARVVPEVASEFERVAASEHMEPAEALKMIVGRFSSLRDGALLDALASIPKEFFKGRPGRPPASSRTAGQGGAAFDDSLQQPARVPVIEQAGAMSRT